MKFIDIIIENVENGQPIIIEPIGNNEWIYRMSCCDCGLHHHYIFRKVKNKLIIKAYRDDYQTKKNRKKKKQ